MGKCGERTTRLSLKILQFLSTTFVIATIAQTGPQWILLLASLIVPPFGLFLLMRSPDTKPQLLPHEMFSAVAAGKRWLRVDVAVCLTMFVIFGCFGTVLLYGYTLIPNRESSFLLLAAIGSIFTSLFYLLNAFVAFSQLRIGTIDFSTAMINHAKLTALNEVYSPQRMTSFHSSPMALHIDTLDRFHQSPLPYPGDTLLSIDKEKRRVYEPPRHFEQVNLPRINNNRRKSDFSSAIEKSREMNIYLSQQAKPTFSAEKYERRYPRNADVGIPMTPSEDSAGYISPEPFQVYDVPPESQFSSPNASSQSSRVLCRSLGQQFREYPSRDNTDCSSLPSDQEYYNGVTVREDSRPRLITSLDEPSYCAVSTVVSMNDYVPMRLSPHNGTYSTKLSQDYQSDATYSHDDTRSSGHDSMDGRTYTYT